jgi:hypothetical protein
MAKARKTKAPVRKATAAPARLPRVAKGRKPQYFADPAVDKLLAITLTLAGELAVTRDRLDAVERLLGQRRILSPQDVDAYEPDAGAARQRDARREAYLDRILRVVQTELEEMTGAGMPRSAEDVIAAVAE